MAVALIVFAAAGFLLVAWRMPAALPRPADFIPDNFDSMEWALAQPGDLIFRRGPGLPSDLIVTYLHDGTGLSHGAMLIPSSKSGEMQVLQSINGSFNGVDGVQVQELAGFNRHNMPGSLVLVRPLWPAAARDTALARAAQLLGKRIPFDNSYDFMDRSALYCSELLWLLVAESGWQATGLPAVMTGPLLNFRTFLDPARFRVLASHNPAIPLGRD